MPRKEYKTISVKLKTYLRFARNAKEARKTDPKMYNSAFLDHLLNLHAEYLGTLRNKKF
ncbi:MAG: hypothetical protein ACYC6W_03700 [Nitrosotalea sp.]